MPTYQYACTACGRELETVQSFTDEPLTECPACAGRLRKRFGSVGVVFKGSGFYRTDSRSAPAADSTSGSTPAASGSGDGGKSEGTTKSEGTKKDAASTSATPSSASAPSSTPTTTPAAK